jgi:hypothetical protein
MGSFSAIYVARSSDDSADGLVEWLTAEIPQRKMAIAWMLDFPWFQIRSVEFGEIEKLTLQLSSAFECEVFGFVAETSTNAAFVVQAARGGGGVRLLDYGFDSEQGVGNRLEGEPQAWERGAFWDGGSVESSGYELEEMADYQEDEDALALNRRAMDE